jgi:hypothetical protein
VVGAASGRASGAGRPNASCPLIKTQKELHIALLRYGKRTRLHVVYGVHDACIK